jgi:hypothetical protein
MQKHPHTIINKDNAHAMITLILTRFAPTKFLLFSIRFPHKKIKKDLRKAKKRHFQSVKNARFGAYVSLKTVNNLCF